MAQMKWISLERASLFIRPWSRFLLLRTSGRCQLAAAWQTRSPATTPMVQPD